MKQISGIVLTFLLNLLFCIGAQEPNVCKTFKDYYHKKNNPNCWNNPDIDLDAVSNIHFFTLLN